MAKINKIVVHNLQDTVLELRDKGYTYKKIANKINEMLQGRDKVSFMSIKRYLDNQDLADVEDSVSKGIEPGREVYLEFREKMDDLIQDMEVRSKDIDKLIADAKKSKDINLLTKLISLDKEYFEQMRRNIISLVQYSEDRFRPIINYSEKKEVVIRNQLLDFTDLLCPVCRSKVLNKVLGGS